MNIDELNPQNNSTNNVPNIDLNQQVPSGEPVVNNGLSPFSEPSSAQVSAAEPMPEQAPVVNNAAQDIPELSQVPVVSEPVPVAPVPIPVAPVQPAPAPVEAAPAVPEQAPVVNNAAPANNNFGELPPLPGQATVNTSDLPPLPAQSVAPANVQDVTVVNTARRKSTSNIILIVLALILVLFVMNIDTVMRFVNENILKTNPISTDLNDDNTGNNNLVDGYIRINDGNSNFRTKDIKFYNFSKIGDNTLGINFLSDKNYTDVESLKLYIEVYNSNKELLTKTQFLPDRIANDGVSSFNIKVDDAIYSYAYYAKVVEYTDEEKAKTQSVTCTFSDSNDNYLLEYKTIYNFTNNELQGYDVSKKIQTINNNKATTNAVNIIDKEYKDVTRYEVQATFEGNVLTYKVDLNNVNEGYIPFYPKGTTPTIIKEKETSKKWICE